MKINVTEITTIYIQFKTNGRCWQPWTVFHFLPSRVDLRLLVLACNTLFTMVTGFQGTAYKFRRTALLLNVFYLLKNYILAVAC